MVHSNKDIPSNQELRTLKQLKNEFISNLNYEIYTSIIGLTDLGHALLETTGLTTEGAKREILKNIIKSADRLNKLVSTVLNLSMLLIMVIIKL